MNRYLLDRGAISSTSFPRTSHRRSECTAQERRQGRSKKAFEGPRSDLFDEGSRAVRPTVPLAREERTVAQERRAKEKSNEPSPDSLKN